ncbi:MAG: PilT/PilU family type 4a pilus ATPase [Gemmataceae bacterium]|nr:PilT/PilU family type 4a pilus ATPase [Gemmata sp.]MDW8196173.1 PilT/PilU family type 4a pilus ATPase [Gemmataceae bacterium]
MPPTSPPPPPAPAPASAHAPPIPINSPEPGLKVAPLPPGEPPINQLFRTVMLHKGSDLHLKAGLPGMMRLRGVIQKMNTPILTQETLEKLIFPIMREKDKKVFEDTGGADFAHVVGNGEARFRVNLMKQRGQLALVARLVNQTIPSFEKLYLPPQIEKLCHYEMGMVLLAGVTGSGKSTTIAAMLDYINQNEPLHILTLEDPIEFVFTDKMSVVNQREIYLDVCDWHTGLKHAVREDPDIILVGELRDSETFEAAVHASETGHVVFGTIHASNAYNTIDRILGLFPPSQHGAVRQSLSFNLKAVVAQKLLPSIIPGVSRVPTNEIMIVNPRIRELILKGEDSKLLDAIRANYNEGMVDFNENLRQLVELQRIDKATALEFSPNPEQLRMALKGIKVAASGLV